MQELFIIHNQQGYFLGKNGEWLDGREPAQLYRSQHKDEAINELFEAGSKNYELRLNIMACAAKGRMLPDIPEDRLPPPILPVSEANQYNEESEANQYNEESEANQCNEESEAKDCNEKSEAGDQITDNDAADSSSKNANGNLFSGQITSSSEAVPEYRVGGSQSA